MVIFTGNWPAVAAQSQHSHSHQSGISDAGSVSRKGYNLNTLTAINRVSRMQDQSQEKVKQTRTAVFENVFHVRICTNLEFKQEVL